MFNVIFLFAGFAVPTKQFFDNYRHNNLISTKPFVISAKCFVETKKTLQNGY